MKTPVTIIMIEDDEGHARLIERNIRRSDVANKIIPFCNGTEAVRYLFGRGDGPLLPTVGRYIPSGAWSVAARWSEGLPAAHRDLISHDAARVGDQSGAPWPEAARSTPRTISRNASSKLTPWMPHA